MLVQYKITMWTNIKLWIDQCQFIPLHSLILIINIAVAFYEPWDMDHLAVKTPLFDNDQPFYVFYTVAFTHISSTHLWNNLIMLLTLGLIVEIVHGTFAHFVIFWGASATGILSESFIQYNKKYIIKGASAGAYGIIGSFIAHITINWREAPLRGIWIACVFLLICTNVYSYATDASFRDTIAHWGHLIGALQGMSLGIFVLKNPRVLRWERKFEYVAYLTSSLLLLWPFLFVLFQ